MLEEVLPWLSTMTSSSIPVKMRPETTTAYAAGLVQDIALDTFASKAEIKDQMEAHNT